MQAMFKLYPRVSYSLCGIQGALRRIAKQNWAANRCFSNETHIVQMRGLDYETSEQDVINFYKPLGIVPKCVHLKCDGSGRTAGISEVEFHTHAEAVVAMRKKNAFLGNKFIRLTLKSGFDLDAPKQMERVQDQSQSTSKVEMNVSKSIEKHLQTGHVIHMKNAPKRMTDQAIYEFFWPVGAYAVSSKPVYNESGLRTGEFKVHFLTQGDAIRAMAKNNTYMGRKFVQLSLKRS